MANIGKLNIEIEANAKQAEDSLRKLAYTMSTLTFGNLDGFDDFTKSVKKLNNLSFDGTGISNGIKDIVNSVSGLQFDFTPITEFIKSIKQLGSKSVNKAISNSYLLGTALNALFTRLSQAPQVSQNVIDMTRALADFASQGGKVGTASLKVVKGLDKLDRQAKKTKKSLGLLGKVNLTHFITDLAVIGTTKAFSAIADGIKSGITYASSLVETQNILQRTFAENIDMVEKFSKTSLEAYGMEELQAKKMIGIYQAMGTSLGETKKRMSSVSVSMAQLVGDYASFFNMEVADVADDFTAIFTGQTKAMRKYGIDLTNANLQQYMLSQGYNVSVKSLDQYSKAIIRYNYLVSRSNDILGDFQRTQGSFANQMKILKQQFQELFGTIGQIGTSVLTPILNLLNAIVSKLRMFANQLVESLNLKQIDISGGVIDGIEDMSDAIDDEADSVKKLKSYSVGIDELNVLKPKEETADTGANTLENFDWNDDWKDNVEDSKKEVIDFSDTIEHLKWVFTPTIDAFKRMYEEGIKPFVDEASNALGQLWQDYLEPLAHWNFRTIIPIVIDINTGVIKELTNWVEKIKVILFDVFDQIKNSGWADAIEKVLNNVVRPAFDFAMKTGTFLLEILHPVIVLIGGAIQTVGTILDGIFSQIDLSVITEPLKDIYQSIINILHDSGLVDTIKEVWNDLQPMAKVLGEVIGKALQFIFTILGEIFTALKPIIEFVAGAVFKGISVVIQGIGKALQLLEKPLQVVKDFLGWIIDKVSGAGDVIAGFLDKFFGNDKKEVEVDVIPKTETLQNNLADTKAELEIEPKVDSEKVATQTNEALTLAGTGENAPKLKIQTEIDSEGLANSFAKMNEDIQTKGEQIKQTATLVGQSATTSLNQTFTDNNATLMEVIQGNADVIKETFCDQKIGLGIKGTTSITFETYASNVVNGFKTGIETNKPISLEAISVWANDIKNTFTSGEQGAINYETWDEYAHQIMLGFAEGINRWSYIAMEAVRKWVEEMMAEFEDDCDIASPSKVFKEYGYYVVAGFNEGIAENENSSLNIIDSWVGDMEEAVNKFNPTMQMPTFDTLDAKVKTNVDMTNFYKELENAQTMGMNTSLNSYAENKQAIQVEIPKISVEIDSREIARANYKGQKQLGYQIKK